MSALKKLLLRAIALFGGSVQEIHLHALPEVGSTVYLSGVFGEVLLSRRGSHAFGCVPRHRMVVAFEEQPQPFRLFAEGLPVDLSISQEIPRWGRENQ